MIAREPIYSALYAQLQKIQGFRTVSRRVELWAKMQPGQLPALFMAQAGEVAEIQTKGMNAKWHLAVDLLVYAYSADDKTSPMPTVNALVDAVDAMLVPDELTGNFYTLGGLVSRCWIEGNVEYFEGILENTTIAVIPIQILAN